MSQPAFSGVGKPTMSLMVRIEPCKWFMNQECLVIACQQLAMIMSLLFVHTARRIKEHGRDHEVHGVGPREGKVQ